MIRLYKQLLIIYALLFIALILMLISCRSVKTVTQTRVEYDSTALKTIERMRKDSAAIFEKHLRETEQGSHMQIELPTNCDTIIIDAHCNYDSALNVINSLKSSVRYYKDGSYVVLGKIGSITTQLNYREKDYDSLASHYEILQKENQDSLVVLHQLRTAEKEVIKKGWPWWIWFCLGFGVCFAIFVSAIGIKAIKKQL